MSIHHYDPCKTLALACALAATRRRGACESEDKRPAGRWSPALFNWIGGKLSAVLATAQHPSNIMP